MEKEKNKNTKINKKEKGGKKNWKNRRQSVALLGCAQSIHCVQVKKRFRDWFVSPTTLFLSRSDLSRICISGDVYRAPNRQVQRKSPRSANNSSLLLGKDLGIGLVEVEHHRTSSNCFRVNRTHVET